MKLICCVFIGIALSTFVTYVVGKVIHKNMMIKGRGKYYLLSFFISILTGLFILSVIDWEKYTVVSGLVWGLLDGILQTFFNYEKN